MPRTDRGWRTEGVPSSCCCISQISTEATPTKEKTGNPKIGEKWFIDYYGQDNWRVAVVDRPSTNKKDPPMLEALLMLRHVIGVGLNIICR